MSVFQEYSCRLSGIEILNETTIVLIAGEHLVGRTNNDVRVVQVRDSNTPFMIQELFTAFPNMIELDVQASNLESINIPDTVQLIWLDLYRNNIARIDARNFLGQSQLQYLYLDWNNIQDIDGDAFEGLESLQGLSLNDNLLQEFQPGLFRPLTNMEFLDIERNNISIIEQDVFATNLRLNAVYLRSNQISEISPHFLVPVRNNLRYINFGINRCANQAFTMPDEVGWIALHNALQTCFNNFAGIVSDLRTVTLEFVGNIVISDEFGNVIARF